MSKLNEVIEANSLLVSLGGSDQMPIIAAEAMERYLELQNRIDRAVEYAKSSTSNSTHANNMVAILLHTSPSLEKIKVVEDTPKKSHHKKTPQKKATPQKRGSGLTGRSSSERKKIRKWGEERNFPVPKFGPVPQKLIDDYDRAQSETSKMTESVPPTESETA